MTEIEIGRNKFLDKIKEGRARVNHMEEEALELSYKDKYEKLVAEIKYVEASAKRQLKVFREPYQPDTIDDRKKVMQYRNAVFHHGFAEGFLGACHQILESVEES